MECFFFFWNVRQGRIGDVCIPTVEMMKGSFFFFLLRLSLGLRNQGEIDESFFVHV